MASLRCGACGQRFNEDNQPIGVAINSKCDSIQHKGPFHAVRGFTEDEQVATLGHTIDKCFQAANLKVLQVASILIGITAPLPKSSSSERELHSKCFCTAVIDRYNCKEGQQATGSPKPHHPKILCMVTGHYFAPTQVTVSHIVSLRDRHRGMHAACGMSPEDVWDPRNGIVWLKDIGDAKDRLRVVRQLLRS
jgi:hypothetical protein